MSFTNKKKLIQKAVNIKLSKDIFPAIFASAVFTLQISAAPNSVRRQLNYVMVENGDHGNNNKRNVESKLIYFCKVRLFS